jgi:hypothetical protein
LEDLSLIFRWNNFSARRLCEEDAELVIFIAENTGKMKSLVASDLDSNLELARQFLNIGKPYLFEGIGHFQKISWHY